MAKTFILNDQCGDIFSIIRKYHFGLAIGGKAIWFNSSALASTNTKQEQAQMKNSPNDLCGLLLLLVFLSQ